jgi:putative addiction module CopG family antidote
MTNLVASGFDGAAVALHVGGGGARHIERVSRMTASRKLDLDDESAAIVAEAIRSGDFEGPKQVVRQALRTWQDAEHRLNTLRAAIEEGAASGPVAPAKDVFTELEMRYNSER